MNIFIKVAPEEYSRLRERIPTESPAHDAIAKAAPIGHAIEGVTFAGYGISCDENQARQILASAKECCPSAVLEIEKAIELARSAKG